VVADRQLPYNRAMLRLLPLLLLVAACSSAPPEPWARADGAPPGAADVSDCRFQARNQAGLRYPDQPPNVARGLPSIQDERRFPAEIRFYEECMTRKGFVRTSAPAR
jgi:hypothetical protein